MSRVCTGDSSQWDMSKTPRLKEGILGRCPNHLNGLFLLWRRSSSTLSSSWMTELCTPSLRERPAPPRRKLHRLHPRSHSFSHYSELVTVREAGDADQLVHWKLCFYTQLSLYLHHWSLSLLYISLKRYSCTSSWRALHSDRSFHSKHRNTKSIIFFSLNKKSHPINCPTKVHENPKHTVFVVCGVSDIFYWFCKLNLLTPSVTYLI